VGPRELKVGVGGRRGRGREGNHMSQSRKKNSDRESKKQDLLFQNSKRITILQSCYTVLNLLFQNVQE
jgi:hypothetical protein